MLIKWTEGFAFYCYQNSSLLYIFTGTVTGMFQDYIARSEVSCGWKCTICGKECAQKVNLVKHVESFHFPDSFAQECKYCGQMFNTKDKRYKHEQINHKN